uniref:Uncharacterized protein n=1 Tax=Nelumbo nucifera TaxID=4432 RepID=A0A822YGD3_NELNU|nr:TPA_asm: hypothetical protein HUJ06_010343 [Nelumbo nucifera]
MYLNDWLFKSHNIIHPTSVIQCLNPMSGHAGFLGGEKASVVEFCNMNDHKSRKTTVITIDDLRRARTFGGFLLLLPLYRSLTDTMVKSYWEKVDDLADKLKSKRWGILKSKPKDLLDPGEWKKMMVVMASFVITSPPLFHHILCSSTWTTQFKIFPLQRAAMLPSKCCSRSIENTEIEAETSKHPPWNISTHNGGGTCTGILNNNYAVVFIALLPLFAEIKVESSPLALVFMELSGTFWSSRLQSKMRSLSSFTFPKPMR